MKFVKLYREPGSPSSGGGEPLPPSLADIDNNAEPAKVDPPTNLANLTQDPPPEPAEGLDADGNLLEGYEELEDGTIQKVETDPAPIDPIDPDEPIDSTEFWTNVDNLTGKPVEVEYGDVDPLSPEGVAMRESVVRDSAVKEFDEYIKDQYPRAYSYFLHVQGGGSDEEFFTEPSQGLVDRDTFESDPDIQANWILNDFYRKGVPEEVAQATIDNYIKNNQLRERALKVYNEQETFDKQRLAQMEEQDRVTRESFQSNVNNLSSVLDKTIKNDMKVVVPESKQADFKKFVMDKVQHDGQKFFFVQEVGSDVNTAMDALYLQYVKGDLNSIIEKRAQSKAVQRLGQRIKSDRSKSSGSGDDRSSKGYVTLGEI